MVFILDFYYGILNGVTNTRLKFIYLLVNAAHVLVLLAFSWMGIYICTRFSYLRSSFIFFHNILYLIAQIRFIQLCIYVFNISISLLRNNLKRWLVKFIKKFFFHQINIFLRLDYVFIIVAIKFITDWYLFSLLVVF